MRRREFVASAASAAIAWPLAARAQQTPMRRVGVLINQSADDLEGQARVAAFLLTLKESGWTEGHNLQVETRKAGGDREQIRKYAAELVALAPDAILASGGTITRALQQATRAIPTVFVNVTDPVGGGLVASLARPGANATGFTQFEYGMSGKWLELLKEVAPRVVRVAVLCNPTNPGAIGQLNAIQTFAPSLGVEVHPIDERDAGDLERDVTSFARAPNGGLIVLTGTGSLTPSHRKLIGALAARHGLPGVYPYRYFVTEGGLMSYGPNSLDPYRRAAIYIARILKGEKPADLPVQAPVTFELVINLATARMLGLTVPPTLVARADEVIE